MKKILKGGNFLKNKKSRERELLKNVIQRSDIWKGIVQESSMVSEMYWYLPYIYLTSTLYEGKPRLAYQVHVAGAPEGTPTTRWKQ